MIDITTLGLEVRSDGVVIAGKRLRDLTKDAISVEKQFGKTGDASSQLMSKFKQLAGALLSIFAVRQIKNYIVEITRVAGQYDMMGIAMHTAGKNAGYSASQMDRYEESLRKTGIASIEARQSITRLAASNVDLSKSAQLARAAQDLAVVGGINSSEAFERMSSAIQKGQAIMLHTLGIQATFEQGYEKTARALGKNTDQLTEYEKIQSRVNLVLEAASKYQGIYEKSMTSSEKQYLSLARHIQTYEIAFGKAFQPAYMQYVKTQTELYKKLTEAVSNPEFQRSIQELSLEFIELYQNMTDSILDDLPKKLENIAKKIEALVNVYNKIPSGVIEAGAYGIIGKMLFGSKVGLIITAISLTSTLIDKLSSMPSVQKTFEDDSYNRTTQKEVPAPVSLFSTADMDRWNKESDFANKAAEVDLENISKQAIAKEELENITAKNLELEKKRVQHVKEAIADMEFQLLLIKETAREQAVLNAVRSSGVTKPEEIARVRSLALAIYDATEVQALFNENLDSMWKAVGNFSEFEKVLKGVELLISKQADKLNAFRLGSDAASIDKNIKALERQWIVQEAIADAAKQTLDTGQQELAGVLAGKLYDLQEQLALEEKIYNIKKDLAKGGTSSFNFADTDFSGVTNAIQGVENLTSAWKEYAAQMQDVIKAEAERIKANKDANISDLQEIKSDLSLKLIQDQLVGYANLTNVAASFYDESSKGREKLHKLEMAFGAASIAMEAKKTATSLAGMAQELAATVAGLAAKGTAAVLNMGTIQPAYLAPAAMAAMAAVVGGLIAAAGGAFSGGGSGTAPKASPTTGTVLGDSDKSSESLINSLEMLEEYGDLQYVELQGIHDEIISLNQNLTGISNSILRTVGVFEKTDFGKLNLETTSAASRYNPVAATLGDDWQDNKYFEPSMKFLTKAVEWFGEGLFGETKRKITQAGIEIGATTIGAIVDGVDLAIQEYAVIKTTKKGWLDKDVSYDTKYAEIDQDTENLINTLYSNTASLLMTYADAFGVPTAKIRQYALDLQSINLLDLSGEDAAAELQGWYSTLLDTAFANLFTDIIGRYQLVNEGLMETATRLLTNVGAIKAMAEATGIDFNPTATVATGTDPAKSAQINAFDYSLSLIDKAGDLDTLMGLFSGFYDDFISKGEKVQATWRSFITLLGNDVIPPGTAKEFVALYQSLDLTKEADQKLAIALLEAAPLIREYYDAIEERNELLVDMAEELSSQAALTLPGMNVLAKRLGVVSDQFYMITDAAGVVTYGLSEMGSTYAAINAAAEEYRLGLIDGGTATEKAGELAAEYSRAMKQAAINTQLAADKSDLYIQIAQANGDSEEALRLQREAQIVAIDQMYGAGTNAALSIKTLTARLWELEDAAQIKEFTDAASFIVLTDGMSDLDKELYSINERYKEQIKIMQEKGALESDFDLVNAAWAIEIRNAQDEAYESIVDFYKELKTKLDDLIWDFRGGQYATVQSEESMAERYSQLLSEALSTGDIDKFTAFVTGEFMDFAKGFGNYSEINTRILQDLEMLQTKLVNEASMTDLATLLETSNLSLAEIVRQTTLLTETIMSTNGFAAGGYHSGGLRVVGERGPELEATGPSRIFNNNDLTSALSSLSKQSNVTVIVRMGTKEFKDFTAETVETHPETQRQIRRVAKG